MKEPKTLLTDLFVGIIVGIVFASKQLFQGNISSVASVGLSVGVIVSQGTRLTYALMSSISSRNLENQNRSRPNEGIRRSLFHGLLGSIIGLFAMTFLSVVTSVISFVSSTGLFSLQFHNGLLNSVTLG